MPVNKADIPDLAAFSMKKVENWEVYLDKAVEPHAGKMVIDVAGWSTFKRLVILEN